MKGTELNEKVQRGLSAQYNPERVSTILTQAHASYHYRNPHAKTNPELYELHEGGFIDEALSSLGFGSWCIGRPKPKLGNGSQTQTQNKPRLGVFRHNTPTLQTEKPQLATSQPEPDNAVSLFLAHIPTPDETRRPFSEFSNAIEYRNLLIVGDQGAGKTTLCESLAEGLEQKWDGFHVNSWIQHSGLGGLLAYGTRGLRYEAPQAWFLVGEDLTLVKIPPIHVNWFFKVRHLIHNNTGVRRGLAITSFNTHTLFGVDKNLRTRFTMMFVKSIPTNPYDRSLLKKYFDPDLLDRFERTAKDDDVLVWDRFHTKGVWAKAPLPNENLLQEVPEFHNRALRWDIRWAYGVIVGLVALLGWALYNVVEVGLWILSH